MKITETTELARFQDDFAQALLTRDKSGHGIAALVRQPAFAIYRNGVMKSTIDSLRANYPAVAHLVGDEWFQAAAAAYAEACPPRVPMLVEYGADFPRFLESFEPALGLPYLPDVARLDRFWTEAHIGHAEAALDPARPAKLTPETLAGSVLRPHPCARWAWFTVGPVYTIWSRNRSDDQEPADLRWRAEGALVVRPHDTVRWVALDKAGCAFLDRCAAGENLEAAAQAAVEADRRTDLSALMCTLLAAGAFADLTHGSNLDEDTQPCLR